MSSNLRIFVFLLTLTQIDFSKENENSGATTDLYNPAIPEEWRDICGLNAVPKIINLDLRCAGQRFRKRSYPNPITTFPKKTAGARILSGIDVQFREAPWTVQIMEYEKAPVHTNIDAPGVVKPDTGFYAIPIHRCTGVLLTMKHILTAANCKTQRFEFQQRLKVFAGSDTMRSQVWSTEEFDFVVHENFRDRPEYTPEYDIGMIVLKTPIDFKQLGVKEGWETLHFSTICLPTKDNFPHNTTEYQMVTVHSWGQTWHNVHPFVLQKGSYEFKTFTENENVLVSKYDYETENQIVANLTHPESDSPESWDPTLSVIQNMINMKLWTRACAGDHGSGLVQYTPDGRAVLVGLVSHIVKKRHAEDAHCDYVHTGATMALKVFPFMHWIYEKLKL